MKNEVTLLQKLCSFCTGTFFTTLVPFLIVVGFFVITFFLVIVVGVFIFVVVAVTVVEDVFGSISNVKGEVLEAIGWLTG